MGVMRCSRKNCDSIMCDLYVDGIGYVCRDCQNEFKSYTEQKEDPPTTEGAIKRELDAFMETYKDTYTKGKEMSVDDFFNSYEKEY